MQCLVSPEADFREIPVFDNRAKITLAARRAEALTSAVAEIKAAGGPLAKRADGRDAGYEHRRSTEAGRGWVRSHPWRRQQCRRHRDQARARTGRLVRLRGISLG